MKVLEGLFYTKSHEWLKVEGNKALIGLTDFAQDNLGDIVYVELPSVGKVIKKGETFSAIESVKAASDVYAPASGKVLRTNNALLDDPGLLNEDCYNNWIVEIELSDLNELNELLDFNAYKGLL